MATQPQGMHEVTPQWRRVFDMAYADLYPGYVKKVTAKGRTRAELDEVFCWLTGHDAEGLARLLSDGTTVERVYTDAPAWNPNAELITGSICGYKVQEITQPLVKRARQFDKLVDELAKGKAVEKVKRS